MSYLELRGLEKSYGALKVVQDVNLSINNGEFISLLGPSGCGKTTTLRMIAGFMEPSAGTISMDGRVISSPSDSLPPEKRGMSMIFQSYAIWPNMTVGENVAFGLKLRRLSRTDLEARTKAILATVRLDHLADRYPAELSGGQQQRVALARAIVIHPKVLLLDEPLSNLDANLREEMRSEIRRLHDEFGMTTVYVTHDQTEAMSTSDRIAVMNGGRVEQIAAPFEIYNRPRSKFVAAFIGRTNVISAKVVEGGQLWGDAFVPLAGHGAQGSQQDISIRPQNIRLSAANADAPPGEISLEGVICAKSYLGESWDYTVRYGQSGTQLKVSTLPSNTHEIGAPVRLSFEPSAVVHLA